MVAMLAIVVLVFTAPLIYVYSSNSQKIERLTSEIAGFYVRKEQLINDQRTLAGIISQLNITLAAENQSAAAQPPAVQTPVVQPQPVLPIEPAPRPRVTRAS